jgi:hypothetical protein
MSESRVNYCTTPPPATREEQAEAYLDRLWDKRAGPYLNRLSPVRKTRALALLDILDEPYGSESLWVLIEYFTSPTRRCRWTRAEVIRAVDDLERAGLSFASSCIPDRITVFRVDGEAFFSRPVPGDDEDEEAAG